LEDHPSVSIIVPVHNGGEAFGCCLASIAASEAPPAEVIVVDDGSTDGSSGVANLFGARVIELSTCGGPARARNLGARAARGEILFFVDADVTLAPDAVGQVVDAFRADSELAAVIGSYDDAPACGNFLSQYKNLLHHYVHQTGRQDAWTFWGACGAIRRRVFHAVGGFDESYPHASIEDIELGYRLKEAGETIRLVRSLQVKHLKVWTTRTLLKADFLLRALPWTELILRRRRAANDLNLNGSSRASVVLAYAMLGCLIGGAWWRWLLAPAAAAAIALLAVNLPVYRFFRRKRGPWFAMQAIPWHWFYYLYGGLAFAIGSARHVLARRPAPSDLPAGVEQGPARVKAGAEHL